MIYIRLNDFYLFHLYVFMHNCWRFAYICEHFAARAPPPTPSPHTPIHKGGGGPSAPPLSVVEGSLMDGCVGAGGAAGAPSVRKCARSVDMYAQI